MKAIIDGKRYDTEKAELVCEIKDGAVGDFRRIDAGLYRTPRSKEFFLAGWGGAMTVFARSNSDNTRSGSNKVIPLSEQDALAWAEQFASVEVIEQFFAVKDA